MIKGKSFVVAVVPLVLSGTALAQPAGTTDPSDPTAPAVAAETDAAASRYPRDVMSRPLTYPAGLGTIGFDVTSMTNSFADPATIRLLGGYGINDDFEINFGHYSFPTDDAGKGSFDVGLGYKLVRGAMDGKLEAIGRVQGGYSLASEGLNPLLVGVHAQYNITPKIGILTPGGQFSAALDGDPKPVTFSLPVSLAVQVTPTVYVQLDTTVATLEIANSANAFIFADSTPVLLTALANVMPALDVFAGFGANLTPADTTDGMGNAVSTDFADTVSMLIGVRYYVGKL